MNLPGYNLEQLEADILRVQSRPFDTYVLPAFIAFYAIRSKSAMSKTARRILFISGIYMGYRNYSEYKKAIALLRENIDAASQS